MKKLDKGFELEERLRSYFLKAGYYVARGVPFKYEGFDVTDIDLWLYGRTSSVSREIAIVDVKNKKTPQALERVFWVEGLKKAVNATNSIVATTDRRKEISDFGKSMGTIVLDGNFLQRLGSPEEHLKSRLSDEEIEQKINDYSLSKLDGDWKGRLTESKELLSKGLNFDSCIKWIENAHFFAEKVQSNDIQAETASRCFFLICSFLSIGLDFILKDLSFEEHRIRKERIKEGLTYGSRGKEGIDKIIENAAGLIKQYVSESSSISETIRSGVAKDLFKLRTTIISEHVSRSEFVKNAFSIARELEIKAYSREFLDFNSFSIDSKSFVFVLLDYFEMDRGGFIRGIGRK